jgi:integrase
MNTVQPIRSKAQVQDIVAYLKSQNERDYILFLCGIYTGLRISDILPLKVRDIRGRENIYIREIKTGKEKSIAICKELKNALKEYVEGMEDYEYLFTSRQKTSRVRKAKDRRPLTRQRAYQIINDATSRFGIENVGTHTMRKTFGYHFYMMHKDVAVLQDIFNHSNQNETLRYIGIDQDKKDDLVKKMSFT